MMESTTTLLNPFRILDSFEKSDEQSFYGRDTEIKELHALLMTSNITLVYGDSGVGKTSLVRCTLGRAFDQNDYLDIWVRRGTNIIDSVRTCLLQKLDPSTVENINNTTMPPLYKLVREVYHEYFKPVYLVFDQFEDLYIFEDSEKRAEFFKELKDIVDRKLNCKVIIVIREDHHGALQDLEAQLPGLYRKGLKIFPLKRDFARTEIIIKYLEASGVRMKPDQDTISELIANNCTPPGQDTIFLPYLGVFLYRLWDRAYSINQGDVIFSEELVKKVGALGNVLRGHLTDAIEEISRSGNTSAQDDDVVKNEQIQLWAFLQEFVEGSTKKCAKVTEVLTDIPYDTKHQWAEKLKNKRILNEFLEKDQYELAHQSLVPLILERKDTVRRKLADPIKGNPYKGLYSYDPDDYLLFFGREKVAEDLFKKVLREDLVAVVGASGTGKSSLVKAGIIPRMEKAGYKYKVIRPGSHPSQSFQEVEDFLKKRDNKATPFLLFVDQFEELSTRCEDELQKREFIKFINDLVNPDKEKRKYDNCKVVLTVRGDFEFDFDRQFSGWLDGKVNVPKFLEADLRKAIVEPAYMAGLEFKPTYLVDIMLSEVIEANSLPLLSHALSRLYNKYKEKKKNDGYLTEADYNEIGGVRGSLGKNADQIYNSYTEGDPSRRTIRNIMLRMTSIDFNTERAGKPVLANELEFISSEENNRVKEVLEKFIVERLIVTGRTSEAVATYEPAHDSLVRTWGLINDWVRESGKDFMYLQARLRDAVKDFQKFGTLWHDNTNLTLLVDQAKKDNWFNKAEMEFIEASVSKKREIELLRKRKEEYDADRKKGRMISGFAILIVIMAAIVLNKTIRSKELENAVTDLAKLNRSLDSANQVASNQVNIATEARFVAEDERRKAEEASRQAYQQENAARLATNRALASLQQKEALAERLEVANSSLQKAKEKSDSTLNAIRILEQKKEVAERLGGWLQLIASTEKDHPALAYRIAEKALQLDSTSQEVVNAKTRLEQREGYIPGIEILNTRYSCFSNNGEMFVTVGKGEVNLWKANGSLIQKFIVDIEGNEAEFSPSDKFFIVESQNRIMVFSVQPPFVSASEEIQWQDAHFEWSQAEAIILSDGLGARFMNVNGIVNTGRYPNQSQKWIISDVQSDGTRLYVATYRDIRIQNITPKSKPIIIERGGPIDYTAWVLPRGKGVIRYTDRSIEVFNKNTSGWDTFSIPNFPDNIAHVRTPFVSHDGRKILLTFARALPQQQQNDSKYGSIPLYDFTYLLNLDNIKRSRDYSFLNIDSEILTAAISNDGLSILINVGQQLTLFKDGNRLPIYTMESNNKWVSFNPTDNTSFMVLDPSLGNGRALIFFKGKLTDLNKAGKIGSFEEDLKRLGVVVK